MSVRRSLFFSFAQKYSGLLFTVPTIMIISRLLTPAEVGVYSVGMAFIALIHMLRDFGVSDFLVQANKIDDNLARTAFTITLVLGWLMALMILALSQPAASFYDEPGLATVLQILSINFFLLPYGAVVHSLLKRSMQFGAIYKIQVVRGAAQSIVTVLLAYLGYSYYGLAWGSVVATVVMIGMTVVVGREYRVVGFGRHRWREVCSFGLQRTLSDIIAKMGENAPDFVIGRIIDFAAVGLYSRGLGLIRIFRQNVLGAIAAVTFPAYARSFRSASAPDQLFLKVLHIISAISWPFLLFVTLTAFPVIRIMFGEQWDAAVPILRLLAIAAVIGIANMDCPQLLVAVGRVGTVTRLVALTQGVRVIVLIATAFYGLEAVAAGQILTTLFSTLCYYNRVVRYTEVTLARVFAAVRSSLAATLVTIAPTAALIWLFPPTSSNLWGPLLGSSVCAALFWLLGLRLARHSLLDEMVQAFASTTDRIRRRLVW